MSRSDQEIFAHVERQLAEYEHPVPLKPRLKVWADGREGRSDGKTGGGGDGDDDNGSDEEGQDNDNDDDDDAYGGDDDEQ